MNRNPDRFARPVLQPGNTAAIASNAGMATRDAWDKPPLSHGFAPPKPRKIVAPGAGFGHAAPALRREATFAHPDHDAPARAGLAEADLAAIPAVAAARRAAEAFLADARATLARDALIAEQIAALRAVYAAKQAVVEVEAKANASAWAEADRQARWEAARLAERKVEIAHALRARYRVQLKLRARARV